VGYILSSKKKNLFRETDLVRLPCLAELQSEKGQAASWKVALPVYGGVRDHLTFGRSVGVDSIWVVVLWCIYSYENLLVSVTRRRTLFF
jgi:hypothetical protein